jgi:hypothetical protein
MMIVPSSSLQVLNVGPVPGGKPSIMFIS